MIKLEAPVKVAVTKVRAEHVVDVIAVDAVAVSSVAVLLAKAETKPKVAKVLRFKNKHRGRAKAKMAIFHRTLPVTIRTKAL